MTTPVQDLILMVEAFLDAVDTNDFGELNIETIRSAKDRYKALETDITTRTALERTAIAIAQGVDQFIRVQGDGNVNGPIWVWVDRLEGSGVVSHRFLLYLVPDDEPADEPAP